MLISGIQDRRRTMGVHVSIFDESVLIMSMYTLNL